MPWSLFGYKEFDPLESEKPVQSLRIILVAALEVVAFRFVRLGQAIELSVARSGLERAFGSTMRGLFLVEKLSQSSHFASRRVGCGEGRESTG